MLFPVNPGNSDLPSLEESEAIKADAIVSQNPITEELCAPLKMPERFREQLAKAWDTQRPSAKFKVGIECHQSVHGFVEVFAEYTDANGMRVGVRLYNEDADDDEVVETIYADAVPPVGEISTQEVNGITVQTIARYSDPWWSEVWYEFKPVEQLKAEIRVGPNSPCVCGSGKKAKKCCGY